MEMMNTSLVCIIAFALLGSMFYMLINYDKNDKILQFASMLSKDQQKVYRNVTQERLNIYLQGFVLGTVIAILYLKTFAKKNQPVYCIFVALVLGVAYIHYTIMPKSTYILDHIENAEQADFACHAGCDLMQGFYYHEPMTISELISHFQKQASA